MHEVDRNAADSTTKAARLLTKVFVFHLQYASSGEPEMEGRTTTKPGCCPRRTKRTGGGGYFKARFLPTETQKDRGGGGVPQGHVAHWQQGPSAVTVEPCKLKSRVVQGVPSVRAGPAPHLVGEVAAPLESCVRTHPATKNALFMSLQTAGLASLENVCRNTSVHRSSAHISSPPPSLPLKSAEHTSSAAKFWD